MNIAGGVRRCRCRTHAPGQVVGFGYQLAVAAGQRQRVVTLTDRADRSETVTEAAKREAMRGCRQTQ